LVLVDQSSILLAGTLTVYGTANEPFVLSTVEIILCYSKLTSEIFF